MENQEIWKKIPHLEFYEASNLGRIRSIERKKYVKEKNGKERTSTLKSVILSFPKHKSGYCYVCIHSKSFKVHRLVAQTFIHNPNNLPYINHINGIKTDNRVENLEWVTHKENVIHSYKIGLQISKKGKEHHRSKKVDKLTKNGEYICTYDNITIAAIENNIKSHINISKVLHGKRISCGGYKWIFNKQ